MPRTIQSDPFFEKRQAMVQIQLAARGIQDARVLNAMARVPRHEFVSESYRDQSYEDRPLPIGKEQTISQPYIVAVTAAALNLSQSSRVLEVGTGSGYQTAILAQLASHVYSIERHQELALSAKGTLERLGYRNITVLVGDGSLGWANGAPYNAIAVSAATARIPQALLDQLHEDGRLVIPVGPRDTQQLQLVRKVNGNTHIQVLENCRFVPLIAG